MRNTQTRAMRKKSTSKKRQLKRVYHPYTSWEEVRHGMWADVEGKDEWLQRAITFTSDHKLYGSYMRRVVSEWPVSCENALTDLALNRKAWIGHAACALAFGCPEDVVRLAWGKLTDEQRVLANKEAARAIAIWEDNYRKDKGAHRDMGEALLFGRDAG